MEKPVAAFYKLPKELLNNAAFDAIDYGAKLLYCLMLDRAELSAQNPDFKDESGNVYIIYTVEQVMADLRCSKPTAVSMLNQLESIGLIAKKRQGQGKPSIIYISEVKKVDFKK